MSFFSGIEDLVGDVSGWISKAGIPMHPWAIYLLLLSTILLVVVLFVRKQFIRKKKKGEALIIVGLCNSGKSALFGRLSSGEFPSTVTSMKANDTTIPISGTTLKNPIRVIDYPGHDRLREGLTKLLPKAAGIIFMVDANGDEDTLRKSADLLYVLFTDKHLYNNQVPFHIACNKSELLTSKPVETIQNIIERELNEVRSSRTAAPGQEDQENDIYLGIEKETFTLSQLPFPVTFAPCSVKNNDLKELKLFINGLM